MRLHYLLTLALLSLGLNAAPVPVETVTAPSPWSVTLRATYLVTTDGSDAFGTNAKDAIKIEDKLIPEFDIDYRFNDNWAIELVLTVPQEHDVKLNGTPIGNFKHLPPTILAKYYPGEWAGFRPYVGAGANFTLIFDETIAGGALKLENYSVGPAAQVGVDYAITKQISLNLDVKRAMLRTDVETAGGTKVTSLQLDPWLLAVGVNYAF